MSDIPQSSVAVATAARDAFGCPPRPPAGRWWDRLKETSVLMMECAPGIVFPLLVRQYAPQLSPTLDHLLFVPPFPWEQLGSVTIDDSLTMHWLLAMPITDAEWQYLDDHGYDALEALFAERSIPYYDMHRCSAV